MPKYVAFLRAINVGGHIVKMDHLRLQFESLGLSRVQTFIASGNVIFESASRSTKKLETKIEDLLQKTLGYRVATFVRTTVEVAAIAGYEPFKDPKLNTEGSRVYIAFLSDLPGEEAKQKLLSMATKVDRFHFSAREVYWLCLTQFSESQFSGARLEKTLGMEVTVRTTTTIKKLAAKHS